MNFQETEEKLQQIKEELYNEYYDNPEEDRIGYLEMEIGNVNRSLTELYKERMKK